MNWQEIAARLVLGVIAVLICRRVGWTQEKAEAKFAKLELDWISGIALALIIVVVPCLLVVWLVPHKGP